MRLSFSAPGDPAVFIDDERFVQLWSSAAASYYLVADGTRLEALRRQAGAGNLHIVAESGGKFLFANHLKPGDTEIGSALW